MKRFIRGVGVTVALTLSCMGMMAPPAQAEEPSVADQVASMTLEEKVGQMMWTHVYGAHADDSSMAAKNQDVFGDDVETPAQAVKKFHLGGVLYFNWSGNIDQPADLEQVATLSNGLQAAAEDDQGIPLAITVDQEGGRVARLTGTNTELPGNMALGATGNTELARQQGEVLGRELAALGINVDFAPDMDVNTNPKNPVIGVRSHGSDPQMVADMGVAQIAGIQSAGTAAVAKHFPGHGDTEVDSHLGLPEVSYDRETLDQHLEPFRAAIDADVDMIMTAHIIVDAIDPTTPGTLSKKVLTGLLREDLGYDGLITTDALDMEGAQLAVMTPEQQEEYAELIEAGDEAALKEFLAPLRAELAVRAIDAGSDILLNTYDAIAVRDGVLDAVKDGRLSEERINASVTRILEWKAKRAITTDPVDTSALEGSIGTAEHRQIADQIADESITVLRNESEALPLAEDSKVLVTGSEDANPSHLADVLGEGATLSAADSEPGSDDIDAAVKAAKGKDHVVVVVTGNAVDGEADLVKALTKTGVPVTVVSAGLPYDLATYTKAQAWVAAYGNQKVNLEAAARVLRGQKPTGKLPIDIPATNGGEAVAFGTGLTWGDEPSPTPAPFETPTPSTPAQPDTPEPETPGTEAPGTDDEGPEPADPDRPNPGKDRGLPKTGL